MSEEKPVKVISLVELVLSLVEWALLLLSVYIVLLFFIFPTRVSGNSMFPSIHDGDFLCCVRTSIAKLDHGDVIVFQKTSDDTNLIKRVIGKPNDVIVIDYEKGQLFRNDELIDEPYINEVMTRAGGLFMSDVDTYTVPEGQVFVLGDNRNFSSDSRDPSIGFVSDEHLKGKCIFSIYPWGSLH